VAGAKTPRRRRDPDVAWWDTGEEVVREVVDLRTREVTAR